MTVIPSPCGNIPKPVEFPRENSVQLGKQNRPHEPAPGSDFPIRSLAFRCLDDDSREDRLGFVDLVAVGQEAPFQIG